MSRLRSLDSRISFFAFADIITAVSGVLIFIALLLATDLGKPTQKQSRTEHSEAERMLKDTLAKEADIEAENRRLQELLTSAETAPDAAKLRSDITTLRAQLAEEKKRQAAVAGQMADSEAAIAARDKVLGLTDLKARVQRAMQAAKEIARENDGARKQMQQLEDQVTRTEGKLLKLHERDGQIWLIPDKSNTTKEPILVTVDRTGVTVERFDKPDQRKHFGADAEVAFNSFWAGMKPLNQYFVFLVRPSGIQTFQEIVDDARRAGFDVGYDALEENREIHFSTPPAADAPAPPAVSAQNGSPSNAVPAAAGASAQPASPQPAATPTAAPVTHPPAANKSLWQRIKEWIGIQ